jgi:hypothetical protein
LFINQNYVKMHGQQNINKRREHGEKDTTVNYVKHLTNETLLLTSKLKDWRG